MLLDLSCAGWEKMIIMSLEPSVPFSSISLISLRHLIINPFFPSFTSVTPSPPWLSLCWDSKLHFSSLLKVTWSKGQRSGHGLSGNIHHLKASNIRVNENIQLLEAWSQRLTTLQVECYKNASGHYGTHTHLAHHSSLSCSVGLFILCVITPVKTGNEDMGTQMNH